MQYRNGSRKLKHLRNKLFSNFSIKQFFKRKSNSDSIRRYRSGIGTALVLGATALAAAGCATTKPMTIDSYPHTDQEKDWFWGIGATNYHPEFKESERLIDKEINEPLGNMFPDWKKPETFKDWSDDYKIWDLWLMLGRDINEKSSWFIEYQLM